MHDRGLNLSDTELEARLAGLATRRTPHAPEQLAAKVAHVVAAALWRRQMAHLSLSIVAGVLMGLNLALIAAAQWTVPPPITTVPRKTMPRSVIGIPQTLQGLSSGAASIAEHSDR